MRTLLPKLAGETLAQRDFARGSSFFRNCRLVPTRAASFRRLDPGGFHDVAYQLPLAPDVRGELLRLLTVNVEAESGQFGLYLGIAQGFHGVGVDPLRDRRGQAGGAEQGGPGGGRADGWDRRWHM